MTPRAELPVYALRDYSLIADGERGALIGPGGDYSWLCAPRWDSDAVFCSLNGGRGIYTMVPDERFVWGGYYDRGSLIWNSRWVTKQAIVECREALAMPALADHVVILRRLRCIKGRTSMRVVLDVRGGYGRQAMRNPRLAEGVWRARTGGLYIRWSGAGRAQVDEHGMLTLNFLAEPGRSRDLVLEISEHPFGDERVDAEALWTATDQAWASGAPDLDGLVAQREARHAYAVLRGLTSTDGGMVAAATLGLPERAEAGRNYDYRYAWIRDQSFAGQAAARIGGHQLLDAAVGFVTRQILEHGIDMKPAYGVDGGMIPDERTLSHLKGYPGGQARAGNKVGHQFQLDAWGEALLLLGAAAQAGRLESAHWRAIEVAVDVVRQRWAEPDSGIWEIEPQRWAHSRLMCVAGLKAVAEPAARSQMSKWTSLADAMLADVSSDCLHPSGRWQRSPGDSRVDAALLFPLLRGAEPAASPRGVATVSAIEKDLSADGYVYRFRQDGQPLGASEGAFLLCGFAMAIAAHRQGRTVDATRWFERNRAACGSPGLFTEEYDVEERQLRGNVPQAFVHALLLECAAELRSSSSEPVNQPG